jgi:hypothetical protein
VTGSLDDRAFCLKAALRGDSESLEAKAGFLIFAAALETLAPLKPK